jgi:valyl-tRNA synthetase
MKEFPKKYDTANIEKKWQKSWQENKIYNWDETKDRADNFVIDTPPPTVSGMLHMGHVFSYTQADFIARFMRMQGKNVFYPMGFDDNGLPTERLVEKIKKIKGSQIARGEFVEICKEVVKNAEEDFRDLFKSIALSIDWQQEYQTIAPETRKISQLSFLDLYHKNHLSRKNEPTYWDPIDQTALAQADLEDKNIASHMNDISFSLENSTQKIIISTTRPELIPACVAIFVHPEDERYKDIIGKNALTALFEVKVPIIADSLVEKDKGTGIVMCCSFGDMMDVTWWKNHNLLDRIILNKYGKIKEYDAELEESLKNFCELENYKNYYKKIENLKAKEAREKIIEIIKDNNLLIKQDAINHPVKCAERSGSPIEILIKPQWFIKILDKKQELLKMANQASWHPHYMKIRIEQWINGLNYDWCISRQRFFGVPFPVWYVLKDDKEVERIIATIDELPVDPMDTPPAKYKNSAQKIKEGVFAAEKDGQKIMIYADNDVMDTWATSSVSPQISSKAISSEFGINLDRHAKLFPADLRPQAHEIIRSWAFYTIVKSYLHEGKLPWYNLMISGWCLASDKTKMSKSKGNVITPVNLIEEKGSDIVRYWAANSALGADTAYSEDLLAVGKKLVNKLWNAAKFAANHLDKVDDEIAATPAALNLISCSIDRWILTKLSNVIIKSEKEFKRYEYAKALAAIDNFFWKDFCDNYLEISKARAYGNVENINYFIKELGTDDIKHGAVSAAYTINYILENLLKLYAPFLPHITEELFSIIFPVKHQKLISLHQKNTWPKFNYQAPSEIIEQVDNTILIIDLIRKNKSDNNYSLKKECYVEILAPNLKIASDLRNDLILLGNIKKLTLLKDNAMKVNISY